MKAIATRRRAGKWAAWAARFESRFGRYASGAMRMALLLQTRGSHTSVSIEQRWLSSLLVRPQFHASDRGRSTVSITSQVFARNVSYLSQIHRVAQNTARLETILSTAQMAPRQVAASRQPDLLKMVFDTRREFAATIESRFLERRESHSARTTERLLHRSERIETFPAPQRALTFRREIAAASKNVAESYSSANVPSSEPPRRAWTPAPLAMPAINVDQLADQVIRQIDRRVVARRERMGRI